MKMCNPRLLILAAVVSCFAFSSPARSANFELPQVRRGVVFIKWLDRDGLTLVSGSGFVAGADGWIYTNRHVARPAGVRADQSVLLVGVPAPNDPDQLDFFHAAVVYSAPDGQADLAVLKINVRPGYGPLSALQLADHPAELGDEVAVLGYPVAEPPLEEPDDPALNFTRGVVSAARVSTDEGTYWQTDAPMNPGNSGGPIVNEQGQVVGMATAVRRGGAEGIGYSLLLETLKTQAPATRSLAPPLLDAGPIDAAQLPPKPRRIVLLPTDANWHVGGGTEHSESGELQIDGNGDSFWLIGTHALPRDFMLIIECRVAYLLGSHPVPIGDMNMRSLFIRFGTPDATADIARTGAGYLLQFDQRGLNLVRNGDLVAEQHVLMPDARAVWVLERHGGKITFGTPAETILQYEDRSPIADSGKLSIGGMLSKLYLDKAVIVDLDRAGSTRPAR